MLSCWFSDLLNYCYTELMQYEVTLNDRGTLTLPAALRRALGLRPQDRLIIEPTEDGLLLRPAVLIPVEIYSDERIAEFTSDEGAIEKILPDLEKQ